MSEKKKSAPLQSKQAIIKPPPTTPRTIPTREYFEFDQYAENGQALADVIDVVHDHREGEPLWAMECGTADADELQEIYDDFDRDRKHYERDELYRKRDKERKTLTGYWSDRELTRLVVAEQVGMLRTMLAFPAAAGASKRKKEIQPGMMIEHIIAANPRYSMLEATRRQLIDTKKGFMSMAEVMEVLREQGKLWGRCLSIDQDDIERCKKRIAKLQVAYEAKQAKEAEEKRLAEERKKEQREKWERERQERLAREQREREEREAKARAEHERKERAVQQGRIDIAVHLMIRRAESRFLWRYLYLLLLSHGIFINDKRLLELARQGKRERWEREWKAQDAAKAAAQRVQARAHCRRLRPRGNGAAPIADQSRGRRPDA